MNISPTSDPKPIRMRQNPMHRSASVSAIIHGTNNNSHHYIDALDRFKKNFADVDKNQRENKRYQKQQVQERKRNESLQREYMFKMRQQQNINKMAQRQYRSQMLHNMGAMKSMHYQSIAVNPINQQYEQNYRGLSQYNSDQLNKVNKLVRAHNLQTHGTSGYNIITGKSSNQVQSMVPQEAQDIFEKKLSDFYAKYRIGPNSQN